MKTKSNYITILSVIACIMVVYLHCNFAFLAYSTDRYWITSNIIRSICYPAVPIFFMITGATLIDYRKKYDTKTFFIKRMKKVLIPFLVWSVLALFYCLYMKTIDPSTLSVKTIINGILNYKYQDAFWYFPVLISVYLCMPLFSSIDEKYKKGIFIYLCIIYLFFNIVYPFVNSLFHINISIPITINVLEGYIFYTIVGYLLNTCDVKKAYRIIIYILGIVGVLLQIIGTWYLSSKKGIVDYTYVDYLKIPCILYAVAVFTFIKNISKYFLKYKVIDKCILFISKYTFAIYLMHNFVRYFYVVKCGVDTKSIFYRTLVPIPIIVICILITYLLRKIKGLRMIVPE